MPPKIALILCILFILYVFRFDFKQKPDISSALWIPLIWFMILASRSIPLWFDPNAVTDDGYEAGSPIDRNVLIMLIVIGVIILAKRKQNWSKMLKGNVWIVIFALYCGISILWSDFPLVALKRYMRGIGAFIMVLVVLTEHDPIEAIKAIMRRCAYVLIPLSIVLIRYYRELGVFYGPWGGEAMNAGVTTNKNSLGRLCLLCGFFFFWQLAEKWRNKDVSFDKKEVLVNILLLLMTFWLLIKSDSATSLGALIIGISIFLSLGLPIIKKNTEKIGIFFVFMLSTAVILQLSSGIVELFIMSLGRDMTLTDRTYLWKDIIALVENPLIGTGYDSFWLGKRLTILWEKWWFHPNEAHNGYLEVYIELGLIGIFLLMGVIYQVYKNINKTMINNFEFGRYQMTYLVIFLIYNITEANLKLRSTMFFVFLLTLLYSPSTSQTKTTEKSLIRGAFHVGNGKSITYKQP